MRISRGQLIAAGVALLAGGGLQVLGRACFKSPASEGHSR